MYLCTKGTNAHGGPIVQKPLQLSLGGKRSFIDNISIRPTVTPSKRQADYSSYLLISFLAASSSSDI